MHVPFSYTYKCEQVTSISTPEYSLSTGQQCPLTTLEGLFCICSMELFWVWLETYAMYGGHQWSSSTARDTWEKCQTLGRNFLLGEHSPTLEAHLLVSTQDKGYFPLCQNECPSLGLLLRKITQPFYEVHCDMWSVSVTNSSSSGPIMCADLFLGWRKPRDSVQLAFKDQLGGWQGSFAVGGEVWT